MSVYERIRMLCKEQGKTVTGTEKELGFARGSLSKIDNHKPSAERLQLLSKWFNVSVDYLMGRNDSNSEILHISQLISENKPLKSLFDVAKDSSSDNIYIARDLLISLNNK